jgi:RNA polymerase sigma factor (sigma-70 family)
MDLGTVARHDGQRDWWRCRTRILGFPIEPEKSTMSDALATQVLLERAQHGDGDALNELCRRLQSRVLTAVRIRLGAKLRQRVQSCDIVQNVMLDVIRNIPSFERKSEGHLTHYLIRVVENKIRDQVDWETAGKRDLRREVPSAGASSADAVSSPANLRDPAVPTPSRIVSLHEDLALLEQAMDCLAEECEEHRDLILAAKIEGRTYAEIAAEHGLPSADAARMQVNRAMQKLAKIYKRLSTDPNESRASGLS